MFRVETTLRINGFEYCCSVDTSMTLLECIREVVGLTGTKCSCENGECGACTVIMDGAPVRSCLILAAEADGADILTVEGLAPKEGLHPLQQVFIEEAAVQCGFCTPGMLMACTALLQRAPQPSKEQALEALEGHLCRCGTYEGVHRAIHKAADMLAQ